MLPVTPFPQLYTSRLCLRSLKRSDEAAIFALRSNETVNRYLDREPARSPEDAGIFIEKINQVISAGTGIYWAIALQNEDRLIGTISYFNITEENTIAEIGYELLPDYHGKGFMQEALTAVLGYGFNNMQLKKVIACTDPHNQPSMHLLEKNGFDIPAAPFLQTDDGNTISCQLSAAFFLTNDDPDLMYFTNH
jgi:[ribosomal protein S5]-alanine N-acetyltransferase